MARSARSPRPWHLLPMGLAALLWYLIGAADYLMFRLGWGPYVAALPPGQFAYLAAQPWGFGLAWAVSVWAGLAGALLLLARANGAAVLLAIAFLATLGATLWLLLLADPPVQRALGAVETGVLVAACVLAGLFWLYARMERRAGVLD